MLHEEIVQYLTNNGFEIHNNNELSIIAIRTNTAGVELCFYCQKLRTAVESKISYNGMDRDLFDKYLIEKIQDLHFLFKGNQLLVLNDFSFQL